MGLATARELILRHPALRFILLEKEKELGGLREKPLNVVNSWMCVHVTAIRSRGEQNQNREDLQIQRRVEMKVQKL